MRKNAIFLFYQILLISFSTAQTLDPKWWVTNGSVNSIVQNGNNVFLGGDFNYVGPSIPFGTSVGINNGQADLNIPKPNGAVYKCLSDGAGGWFIGGEFTQVGGQPRTGIARINADGTLHPWSPNIEGGFGKVSDMAINDNLLYVGGFFESVNGQSRNNIASFDLTSGLLTTWNPNCDGSVGAIAVNGNTVYVGGVFEVIGGQSRNNIAALDVVTGVATSWNPNPDGSDVYFIEVNGNTVYVGGVFEVIGGQRRKDIAAVDAVTGIATSWNPNIEGVGFFAVYTLAVDGNTVYVGGNFESIGGQRRNNIAALDSFTGAATSWNPNIEGGGFTAVYTLAVDGNTVYVGGNFESIGGQGRNNIAAVDAVTGAATSWNPSTSNKVFSIALTNTKVFLGGSFTSVGGVNRKNLAALNATTGAVTSWNPNANGRVHKLASVGNIVYAIGRFSKIGEESRSYLAAIDATTGVATSWNPNPNRDVYDIDVAPGTPVYVSGWFTFIGGQSRNYLAALSTTDASATAWNPDPGGNGDNFDVSQISLNGNILFAAGLFDSIGGQEKNSIAAINTNTGEATGWVNPINPIDFDIPFYKQFEFFTVKKNRIYLAQTADDLSTADELDIISKISCADTSANSPTIYWEIALPGVRLTSVVCGPSNILYVAGIYSDNGKCYLKAFNGINGTDADWEINGIIPSLHGAVEAISFNPTGDKIYIGGGFNWIDDQTRSNFAVFSPAAITSLPNLITEQKFHIYPNPVQCGTTINIVFKDAEPGNYQLSVYNVSGLKLLNRNIRLSNNVDNSGFKIPGDWQSGTYFAVLTNPKGKISGQFKFLVNSR